MQARGGRRLRGISNTIAGLIVFTFVALALIPLLLNIFVTNTQGAVQLAQALQRRIASASQGLNVTLDVNASSPPALRVYDVVNNAANDKLLILLTIEDNGGNIYLVRPGACVAAPCSAGAASVRVEIPAGSRATPVGENLLLHPRDTARVVIDNGKLLGLTLEGGAYVKPYVPPTAATVVPQRVQYAAVAGSVKTNYFQLGKFNDLSQLVNSNDVALTTNPFEDQSNKTILWKGALQSECVVDNRFVVGGFQPISGLNESRFDALFVTNLLPYGGSIAVGGTKPPYNAPGYGSGALYMSYGYMVFNSSAPAAVIAKKGSQWIAVMAIPDGTGKEYLVPMAGDSSTGTVQITTTPSGLDDSLTSLETYLIDTITSYVQGHFADSQDIHTLVYYSDIDNPTYLTIDKYLLNTNSYEYYDIAWLDTGGFGLLLYMLYPFKETVNYGIFSQTFTNTYSVLAYCPPSTITGLREVNGALEINVSGCPVVLDMFGSSNFYEGIIVNASISISDYIKLGDGTYVSNYNVTAEINNLTIAELAELKDIGVVYNKLYTPYRVKVDGSTYMLEIYNAYTNTLNRGANAFGFYFYADNKYIVESYREYPEYVFIAYDLRNANLTVFKFESGATSGIMPFMAILDTDGNSLKEIVFLGENAGFGYYDTWDGDNPLYLADIDAGCMDKTLEPLYLKFVGSQYLINGSQIAEVSMQIRYTFHDSAADDIKDVDNPKNFIMSFQLLTPNNTVFMSSDYIYQQLANLEDTWPPNHNWVSDSVYLLVPDKNALYTVAFAINDPYGWSYTNNDMDYTLSVEWLGMWYLHR